jgi:hydroxymethylglutaryl-CoA synthase
MTKGVLACGAYLPKPRLNRSAAVQANRWFNSGIAGLGKGERTFCNWDEDSITLAVEAARSCLGATDAVPGAVVFASTTPPFDDRQNAGIICSALDLAEETGSYDHGGSQRAATSALIQTLDTLDQRSRPQLLIAAEARDAKAATSQELQYGDGAAALLLGAGPVIAEILATRQSTVDFVDHYRGRHQAYDYSWEERWVRDEGLLKIIPPMIRAIIEQAGLAPADIDRLILPMPAMATARAIAKAAGIADPAVSDVLQDKVGHCGTAHPLLMLVKELEEIDPGKTLLIVGWGQGCDAILLRTTEHLAARRPERGFHHFLDRRREETNYARYLAFKGLIEIDRGLRSEVDKQTALTALHRNRRMILGLVGGACSRCGTAQFPRTRVCVDPNCGAMDTQEPVRFADRKASVLSWTADRLTYSPDPPQNFGMVVFQEGGRLMMDFTDVGPGELENGTEVRMVFRIKDFDDRRTFTRYFWKAVPDCPRARKA